MLPKRSTHVDQNLESESIYSQLSVAIFMASSTHLGTQECMILEFYPQKRTFPAFLYTNLGSCLIYDSRQQGGGGNLPKNHPKSPFFPP